MKNTILSLSSIAVILFGPNAYALHFFNCSNPNGSVKIVEEEIWGSNPVGCYYKGEQIANSKVILDKNSKIIIRYESSGPNPRLDWKQVFTVRATMSVEQGWLEPPVHGTPDMPAKPPVKSVKADLICEEISTSALDFVGPTKSCKVIEE